MASSEPSAVEGPALDERDAEPRTPMRRLGSTRKLAAFANIKLQLAEQSRVLESRAEATAGVAGELGEYCRRRADLEHEYSRALDKLARAAAAKHKDQRHKREQWPLVGAFAVWQAALEQTRSLSRDHGALADLYGGPLAARLARAADDALRLHRKCRDIVSERHEEVGGALCEAGAAGKAHAAAAGRWRAAAGKLRQAKDHWDKVHAQDPTHKKMKALDKELEKRRSRHSEARARALRARADYALSLEAANATLQRYYLDDIADIMLCMEVGFEAVVGKVARTAALAEEAAGRAACSAALALVCSAEALDALSDRQRLVTAHAAAFSPPRPLPYRGPPPDSQDREIRDLLEDAAEEEDEASLSVSAELSARLQQLEAAAVRVRAECREAAKTLDAAEDELVRQMEGDDIDVTALFGRAECDRDRGPLTVTAAGDDEPRRDQEDYYLQKFRTYVCNAGRLTRLESRAACLRAQLPPSPSAGAPPPLAGTHSPGEACARGALRRGHFARPLQDQLPLVLTSCVRVIAAYGRRHQGIFRVSGSHAETQALRAAFERGGDPLAAVADARDINSVCGLLKLYLRSVRPPLIPPDVSARLLRVHALHPAPPPHTPHSPPSPRGGGGGVGEPAPAAAAPADAPMVAALRDALSTLPRANMLVLRYLAAFLHHLTQYSSHNMMDAWNLSICLGPTVLSAGGEGGAQVTQQNAVNELLRRVIVHHKDLFPADVAPHTLYVPLQEADVNADEADGVEDEPLDADADEDGDPRDDLSLYADDDDVSSEGDSGDWRSPLRQDSAERDAAILPLLQIEEHAAPSPAPAPPCRRLAETTPDLVLDLPARSGTSGVAAPLAAAPPAPAPAPAPLPAAGAGGEGAGADPERDPADTFAHNRDTLKKRRTDRNSSPSKSSPAPPPSARAPSPTLAPSPSPSGIEASPPGGSPVPARNTQRVAAKFAELTLTGGSLKPALAAKPALLRRPTPHPHPPPHRADAAALEQHPAL